MVSTVVVSMAAVAVQIMKNARRNNENLRAKKRNNSKVAAFELRHIRSRLSLSLLFIAFHLLALWPVFGIYASASAIIFLEITSLDGLPATMKYSVSVT